jgi:imidazolonepropionase-like amidohydrolase
MRRLLLLLMLLVVIPAGHPTDRLSARAVDPSPVVVLRGATVVVGNGQVLQAAVVVLRGGLIESGNPKAPVAAGAREIDLKGTFLYPGLIDAMTDQGLQKPPADATEKEPTDTESAAMFAHVRAADLLDPTGKELESWRDAGILAVNVAPSRGIFMGQSAVVSLNGEADRAVVKPSVAMRVALQGLGYRNRRQGQPEPGGVYPTRLIGVLAYIRQTLLDAHYLDDAQKAYSARPGSIERPAVNRGLEALLPVARRTMPLMFPAEEQRQIQRVIDIADQTKVNCMIVGGYEAADMAAALKPRNIPVLFSLNYPTRETDVHPEFQVAVRVLRFQEHAPRAAGELAKAGVRLAFSSAGLKSGADFLANLRLAVKAGLPRDAAIRGATLTAAEILGVDQQLGSIEAGKIANLVVADGDLFDDQTRIRSVFVDGKRHDVAAPTRRPTTVSAAAAAVTPPAPLPQLPVTPREVLITNATVMTVTHATIKGGSVLMRDGKIAAVGRNLAAGPQALVIDASGKWVTPGIIDAHEHIPTDSHNEATMWVTAQTSLKDNLNPTDIAMYRILAGGVTTINVFHGSVNPIGGKSAVIKLRWGKDMHGLLFEGARPSLKMSTEEFPPRQGLSAPSSYMGEEALLCEVFEHAQQYRQRWEEYEKTRAAGVTPLLPPRRDLAMDALVEVLKGERDVRVHDLSVGGQSTRGMLMMMRVAEEFGFRIKTFEHAPTAYRIAEELKRHGAGASIFSFFDAESVYNAAMLTRKGVVASINSDGEALGRDLNQQAGELMKYGGLTEDEALALVTLNPARQLGVDKRVGSIEVGKDADLVIWNHYPLSVYAIADKVFIDGQLYYSREHEKERQAWVDSERKRLASPSAPAATETKVPPPAPAPPTAGATVSLPAPAWRIRPTQASYVIQHAKVVTVSGPTLDDGSVVISNGLIADVGPNVAVPRGAHVIDGHGLTVYPGLFDADSSVGMSESAPESQIGQFLPHLTASTSFLADGENIPRLRAAGITHVLARPMRGMLPGQGEIMNLDGWTGEEMLARPRTAMLLAFPSVGALQYTDDERFQVTPFSVTKAQQDRRLRQLKDFFATARAYVTAKAQDAVDTGFTRNDQLEAMIPVLEGREPVIIETANHVDIQNAVQFAREEHLNYVIGAASGAWRVADYLKQNGVRVLVGWPQNVPEGEDDPIDSVYRTAAILHEKGVPVAISTLAYRLALPRVFPHAVGNTVAHGLPYDVALRSVTLTPAEFLGVADRLGSIDKGKIANLVVATGDIFEGQTEVKYVFINGEPASLDTSDRREYEKYMKRPAPPTVSSRPITRR